MRMIQNSRLFNLTPYNKEPTHCFVPMADMINHSNNPNCAWRYDDEKKGFVIEAKKNIKQGEELVESYLKNGHQNNSFFFLHYGFVNQGSDKIDEDVCLELELDQEDPLYDTKS